MRSSRLHLFEGFGVEIEYMIVDRRTLMVLPTADKLLAAEAGTIVSEIDLGAISWSNELVLHVIELKTNGPAPSLAGLAADFAEHVQRVNSLLQPLDGRLMPTGAHPLMDPMSETRLWPHEYSPVYAAYDRIFGCRGHGWSNLQSTHINLPFATDAEFERLHAAIRLLMPVMPALTASSPILDGRPTGYFDSRLEVYGKNSLRIPSVAGKIIPERAFSRREYDELIFSPMYRDIAQYDEQGLLRDEFLNSRGAIARFDRGSVEIRILDVQESPRADLACAGLIVAVLQALIREECSAIEYQKGWPEERLAAIYLDVIRHAQDAWISDTDFLQALGMLPEPCTCGDLWRHLAARHLDRSSTDYDYDPLWTEPLECILNQGCLARRIMQALGPSPDRQAILDVYADLCGCLASGEMFRAAP